MDGNVFESHKHLLQTPVKINGFMNFLRVVVKHANSPPDLVVCGDVWNQMSDEEKESFRQPTDGFWGMGLRSCPPKKKRRPFGSCRKTKKCRSRKKNCGKKRRKARCKLNANCRQQNSLPRLAKRRKMEMIPNNGYLNFLRAFKRKHWNMKSNDLVMKAARAWSRLTETKKLAYSQHIRES